MVGDAVHALILNLNDFNGLVEMTFTSLRERVIA